MLHVLGSRVEHTFRHLHVLQLAEEVLHILASGKVNALGLLPAAADFLTAQLVYHDHLGLLRHSACHIGAARQLHFSRQVQRGVAGNQLVKKLVHAVRFRQYGYKTSAVVQVHQGFFQVCLGHLSLGAVGRVHHDGVKLVARCKVFKLSVHHKRLAALCLCRSAHHAACQEHEVVALV